MDFKEISKSDLLTLNDIIISDGSDIKDTVVFDFKGKVTTKFLCTGLKFD